MISDHHPFNNLTSQQLILQCLVPRAETERGEAVTQVQQLHLELDRMVAARAGTDISNMCHEFTSLNLKNRTHIHI